MNPRHRRLLIPGLLIALLAIVVIASLAGKADAATAEPEVVSTLSDRRIEESSGLATSADQDLVFTINDSGGTPVVYAVEVSSGSTVGTATVDRDFVDSEAISRDAEGTLWVADTGDNRAVRTDAALYSLAEFGRGDGPATSVARFPVVYPGGPIDVEALVVSPTTGAKFLISKGLLGGTVFALPDPLVADRPNEAVALEGDIPGLVTDASFTPDGRHVVARDYTEAFVLDAKTWQIVSRTDLPSVDQGESLAVEASGQSVLVGSEGEESPLIRVPLSTPDETTGDAAPAPDEATPVPPGTASAPPAGGNGFAGATWFWATVVVGLLAAISAAAVRKH